MQPTGRSFLEKMSRPGSIVCDVVRAKKSASPFWVRVKGDRSVINTLRYKKVFIILFPALLLGIPAFAQNPQLQERLGEIKQAAAANKQALAQYTWQEQQTSA
jgi:hypothetical protein